MSPARRRAFIDHVRTRFHLSERRASRVLGQHRSTQRKVLHGRADEESLVADKIELARQYGRYGYRRVAALLRDAGWEVNDKRVERLWRREGLKVPMKQPKKGRLWLNDGSCVRLRPEYRNHIWSYDFVHFRTEDGKVFRTLNILDEHSRECLAIRVKRKLNSGDVTDALSDLFIVRACRLIAGQTMARSSWRRQFRTGLPPSARKPHTSSLGHPGRTTTARASMPGSAMSAAMGRSSTAFGKRKS